MAPKILDGKWLAQSLHKNIKSEVLCLKQNIGRAPGLAVILVGDNPASKAYVGRKEKVAKKECSFETFDYYLPKNSSDTELKEIIAALNKNSAVDGILLQLPLPKHLHQNVLLDLIAADKDADGLHPLNQGFLQRGQGKLRPCTPVGAMRLIDLAYSEYESGQTDFSYENLKSVDLTGRTAVVIGRSILVGKPVAALLLERNATVILTHSKTKDLNKVVATADIVVAAVGVPLLVKADWVKPGAIVIDVGINKTSEGKIVGDVDFENVQANCFAITPVPGGCGPMTVAMLMYNTLQAYKSHNEVE